MIEIRNVYKSYKKGINILSDVSLDLPSSGLVIIYGKSGSGKTTLLNLIGGLDIADSGTISICDNKYKIKNLDNIRNNFLSYIFQNYYLEPNEKVHNILLNQFKIANSKKSKEEQENSILSSLKYVGMEEYLNRNIATLSGGQMQRTAIARALVRENNIILADEPTGNLDSENTIKIMDLLKSISFNKLVVLVTHEQELVDKYADYIIEISDGRIIRNEVVNIALSKGFCLNDDKQQNNYKEIDRNVGKLFKIHDSILVRQNKSNFAFNRKELIKYFMIFVISIISFLYANNIFNAMSQYRNNYIDKNVTYVSTDDYQDVSSLFKDAIKYDIFTPFMFNGGINYIFDNTSINMPVKYSQEVYSMKNELKILSGRLPKEGEVIISTKLYNNIKKHFKIADCNDINNLINFKLNSMYKIVGIFDSNLEKVMFNMSSYINNLKLFENIQFIDKNKIFFNDVYAQANIKHKIKIADDSYHLRDDEAIYVINRHKLFKLFDDINLADKEVSEANLKLLNKRKAIQIKDSRIFIKKIVITEENIDCECQLLLNNYAVNNVFYMIKPNFEIVNNFREDNLKKLVNKMYLKLSGDDNSVIMNKLESNSINIINMEKVNRNIQSEFKGLIFKASYFYCILCILLIIIYYFVSKSISINSLKDIAIYRMIGVKKRNIFNKLFINSLISTSSIFLIFDLIVGTILGFINVYKMLNVGVLILLFIFSYVFSVLFVVIVDILPYLLHVPNTAIKMVWKTKI